jgi:hypothetical protein
MNGPSISILRKTVRKVQQLGFIQKKIAMTTTCYAGGHDWDIPFY